jgi:iron only hydrogenase large subunit-like protein
LTTFSQLYQKLVSETIHGINMDEWNENAGKLYDSTQLDCLLHPKKHPVIWQLEHCTCPPEQQNACAQNCPFAAITPNQESGIQIDPLQCAGCGSCVEYCPGKKLTASRDVIPALRAIRTPSTLSYALIAPAFLGQFSGSVTPGKLRSAFKHIGFDGMIEVSLFADILTLREALTFSRTMKIETDFQLTSCCCPMWIAMIRKVYHELLPHVPGSVSPMIASGRTIKKLYPNAVTVFIGPCMAKKAEAREPDLAGAIDYVLTFQEVQDIFDAMNINPAWMEELEKDHSSQAGRIYARTGGVSEAVQETVKRLSADSPIAIRTRQADGVPACKQMLLDLQAGKIDANFFEGMGCIGGCVGGPRRIIDTEQGRTLVNEYGKTAYYQTPIENPYVIELLHRLGFDTIDDLLQFRTSSSI